MLDWLVFRYLGSESFARLGVCGLLVLGACALFLISRVVRRDCGPGVRCAGCGYDLTGLELHGVRPSEPPAAATDGSAPGAGEPRHPAADRCPECGADLSMADAVDIGGIVPARWRWRLWLRRALAAMAAGLWVVAAVAGWRLVAGYPTVKLVGSEAIADGIIEWDTAAAGDASFVWMDQWFADRAIELWTRHKWAAVAGRPPPISAERLDAVVAVTLDVWRDLLLDRVEPDDQMRTAVLGRFLRDSFAGDFGCLPSLWLQRADANALIEDASATGGPVTLPGFDVESTTAAVAFRRFGSAVAAELVLPHAPLLFAPADAGVEPAGSVYAAEVDPGWFASSPLRFAPEIVAVELREPDSGERAIVEIAPGQPRGAELNFSLGTAWQPQVRTWPLNASEYIDWTPVHDAMRVRGWSRAQVSVTVDVSVRAVDADRVIAVDRVTFDLFEPARALDSLEESVRAVAATHERIERIARAMRAEQVRIVRQPDGTAQLSLVLYHVIPVYDTSALIAFEVGVEWAGGHADQIDGQPVRSGPLDSGDPVRVVLDASPPVGTERVDIVLRPNRRAAIRAAWQHWATTGEAVPYLDGQIRLAAVGVEVREADGGAVPR